MVLVALGFVLLLRPSTPEPAKEPAGPAVTAPPKAATGLDQRVVDWVRSHNGNVALGTDDSHVPPRKDASWWVVAVELKDQPTLADMPPLGGLTHLRQLRLERCGITDQAVADMPEMSALVTLSLTVTGSATRPWRTSAGFLRLSNSGSRGRRSPMPLSTCCRPVRP